MPKDLELKKEINDNRYFELWHQLVESGSDPVLLNELIKEV